MRPDISVTEPEPCGLDPVRGELLLGAEGFGGPATPVDSSPRVYISVQIGAHPWIQMSSPVFPITVISVSSESTGSPQQIGGAR